MVILKCSWEVD